MHAPQCGLRLRAAVRGFSFSEENERARRTFKLQKLDLEAQRLDLIRQGKINGAADPKLGRPIANSLASSL